MNGMLDLDVERRRCGERPAGATRKAPSPAAGSRPVHSAATCSTSTVTPSWALRREDELDVSSIADRVPLEATQVSSLLPRLDLEHDGLVTRTAEARWRLTPAAEASAAR
jgi:hypothetical protein